MPELVFPNGVPSYGKDGFHNLSNLWKAKLLSPLLIGGLTIELDTAGTITPIPSGNFLLRLEEELIFIESAVVPPGHQTVTLTVAAGGRAMGSTQEVDHFPGAEVEGRIVPSANFFKYLIDNIVGLAEKVGPDDQPGNFGSIVINTTDDNVIPLTINIPNTHTTNKWISLQRGGVEVGALHYDSANDEIEFRNITIAAAAGSNIRLDDDRSLLLGTDSDASIKFVSADNRVLYAGVPLRATSTSIDAAIPGFEFETTFNDAGEVLTGFRMNVTGGPSAAGSKVFDFLNAGVSKLKIDVNDVLSIFNSSFLELIGGVRYHNLNILPKTTDSFALGDVGHIWSEAHIDDIYLTGGIIGNVRWYSGTANIGSLDHSISEPRTWTFPNRDGTVLLEDRQIISGDGLTGGGDLSADLTLAVGAGDGISVSADAVAVDATVVRTTRTLTAGSGLSGGGDLSANRTFNVGQGDGILVGIDDVSVDSTVVRITRQVIAGSGLTGGGDLSADVTLNVGAGDGISVNANDVAVDATVVRTTRDLIAGAGLTGGGTLAADRTFAVGAGTGITVNADDVAIDQAFTPTWTGLHTFTKGPITPYTALSSDTTLTTAHDTVGVTTGATDKTITLPSAAAIGTEYFVKKIDSGVGNVIVDAEGSDTIDGVANYVLTLQWEGARFKKATASTWIIVGVV